MMERALQASRTPGFAVDGNAIDVALSDARRAAELDPTWTVPLRFIDDWDHRRALTLPSSYGEHLKAARAGSAAHAYLAGRLGGEHANARLDHARRLDPLLGWAWHGEAWRAYAAGRIHRAVTGGTRAVRYAKSSFELAHFSWALARYLRADERASSARAVLEEALLASEPFALGAAERAMVESELALAELESIEFRARRRGAARGVRLLADPALSRAERASLALALSALEDDVVPPAAIELALFEAGAEEMIEDSEGRSSRSRLVTAAADGRDGRRFLGEFERWCAALPLGCLDEDGGLARKELRALAQAARAHGNDGSLASALDLCDAMLAAGWFNEARALTRALLASPEDRLAGGEQLRELQGRSLRGVAMLAEVGALARRIDARSAFLRAGAVKEDGVSSDEAGSLRSLEGLTQELARILGEATAAEDSLPMHYGPLGAVLHPGPTLSAEDEALGRGRRGDEVRGVAGLFRRMGRFALIGQGVGQGGPDATVLRLIHVEQREGEHLGRPFRGTVFWCDGADVPGRFGRLGASISGAALHEGYYVDLEMVALEKARWDAVHQRFNGDHAAIERALLAAPASAGTRALRRECTPPLGAADRMRLAVMAERGTGANLAPVTLAELAEVVAVHEEGHLCDRGQWYPLGFGSAVSLVSFAAAHGFDPGSISRALEARAQLVALCESQDVRLAWIDILDAADGEAAGVTPHARAYRGVLQDLVDRLDNEFEAGSLGDLGLDPGGRWVDQLHRLDPEVLRGIARREAASRGLSD